MGGAWQYINIGEELYRRGDLNAALQAFGEALKALPSSARAHSDCAAVYWNLGDRNRALEHLEKALELAPENRTIVLNAVEMLRGAGQEARALNVAAAYTSKHPEDREAADLALKLQSNAAATIDGQSAAVLESAYVEQQLCDRVSIINYCIERFGYEKYLEIGCHENETFARVKVRYRVGVDPVQGGTLRLTSDEFFRLTADDFDLIFIDGLHYCEQVYRDVKNSLVHLRPNGMIVLHDCNPQAEAHQLRDPVEWTWHGDVWKAFVLFRQDPGLDCIVGDFDGGVGLIRVRGNSQPLELSLHYRDLTWKDLVENRQTYLRLCSEQQIKLWL